MAHQAARSSAGAGARARASGKRGRQATLERPIVGEVLNLIWREREISRAETARRTGLSRSTVSGIVDDLLLAGLVSEVGDGPSSGGRRPVVLRFEDDAYAILGIDMGAAHVAVALTNLRGRVLGWAYRAHPVRSDPDGTLPLMTELAGACLAEWRGGRRRLVGIGVAVPSPVDPENRDLVSEVVMPEWRGRSIGQALRAKFGVPVLVDNDANLGALAESWWGAGHGVADFAYLKVATGVGSGHIIKGEIYRGAHGVAGEVGHLVIDPRGDPCVCGLRGCLATRVGSRALVARASALLVDHPDSALAGRELTISVIEDAALAGDPLASQVVREAAEYLGFAVAGMLNLMDPGMVVIGGGLARLGELLLEPLRQSLHSRTLVTSIAPVTVTTSQLGPRAVAIGAATLILQKALADLRQFPVTAAAGR
jgi:glucokinase-like ROK family protein